MNKHETLTLLDGHFTAEEAREVLMSIFYAKIHFHEMKNFSSQERFGCKDEVAVERIPKLKESMKRIQELVIQAAESRKSMLVTSVIKIEFKDAVD